MNDQEECFLTEALIIVEQWSRDGSAAEIICHVINGTQLPPGSQPATETRPEAAETSTVGSDCSPSSNGPSGSSGPPRGPLVKAWVKVICDGLVFIFGLVCLKRSWESSGCARSIEEPKTKVDEIVDILKLLKGIWDVSIAIQLLIIKGEKSLWEWAKAISIALAQSIAWFASDNVAFIAEVFITSMSLLRLLEDLIKVYKILSKDN